jgi:hypothetical protein
MNTKELCARTKHPERMTLGPVTLEHKDGELLATHKAVSQPVKLDPKQLIRWVLRQLRETVK